MGTGLIFNLPQNINTSTLINDNSDDYKSRLLR